ncbi:hypothetical protein [Cytobacillus sp. IB215665]|uniref:hypothetical protein n=1 Tax=Cytobacillus sp. IB215665 TaxID=3097357 RepID=UPI002A158586|nr:hypothetical protein [Cytobacillus sp. IB215665]MDX8364431.1 hypothetical protein [Cytobacillus sp. IB215665]
MIDYFTDFAIVAVLIIGITAMMGVMLNGIGEKFFGGRKKAESFNQSANTQVGWRSVGGKRN